MKLQENDTHMNNSRTISHNDNNDHYDLEEVKIPIDIKN